jgi:hypothetical protein
MKFLRLPKLVTQDIEETDDVHTVADVLQATDTMLFENVSTADVVSLQVTPNTAL